MFDSQVITFTGIAILLTLTPGADTMLVVRNVLGRGKEAGILSTLGICSGLFIHASMSALGLSIILVKSATAFEFVKWAGAGYLIYLGIQSLIRIRNNENSFTNQKNNIGKHTKNANKKSLVEGFLSNILNPKVAVFYLAFLPQFIKTGDPVFQKSLLLAAIHAILGILWLSFLSICLSKIRNFLLRPKIRKILESITGAVLIILGIRLAFEKA
jgi:RhtB (resistance to homoserine/threonine) family protein